MHSRLALVAALVAAIPVTSFAQTPTTGQPAAAPATSADAPRVTHPWARRTAPRQTTGAAYMTLQSGARDTLVGATADIADRVELHEMSMDNTIMRMREVSGVQLPAGQPVALAPGGYHFMLIGLKQPLKPGDTFPMHLRFQSGRTADVTVAVEGTQPATASKAAGAMKGMGHARH